VKSARYRRRYVRVSSFLSVRLYCAHTSSGLRFSLLLAPQVFSAHTFVSAQVFSARLNYLLARVCLALFGLLPRVGCCDSSSLISFVL
jgi:hypothetical protein